MALSDSIGLEGPAYEVDIERGKIREFTRAMAAPLPEFIEGQTPLTPPTFLVSAPYTWGYTVERPRGTVFEEIDFDPAVSLHAEESFEFFGPPPRAGDRLIAKASVESVSEKQGANGGHMTFCTMLTEYRTHDGGLRAQQRSTSVATSANPGSDNWDFELPEYKADYPTRDVAPQFTEITRKNLSDLEVSKGPGPVLAGPLMMRDIIRFQGVVGEDDPLHHDLNWAKQCGYPEVFALGMHQASMLASYASHWLEPEAVRSFKVRFRNVSWPGDRLVYEGTAIEKDTERQTARIHLTTSRENGDVLNEAWMDYEFEHA